MSGFTRRAAVVTGGAGGIGAGIAARLSADGFRVIVLDQAEPAARVDRFHVVDLSDAAAVQALCARVAAEEEVTCLVNNVGIVCPAPLEEVDPADFDRLLHVNLRPSILCAQAFLPGMKAAGGGRIVMNTSRVTLGKERRTLYSASKGAAQSMARTWALELGPHGITVNCVAPGPIGTDAFWRNNPPDAPLTREIIDHVPLRRVGTVEDVANAVSFFCAPEAGFVTGQTLFVCGGVTVG
ncbi:SDR family NAD(P)-dependent oxidoreductase [Salipiger marinus]|uniref:SDR family NAD(P)-dependent oxidoreductase n=1 Tax=Salipiger marinus TaxID=555512 RepID=UPI001E2E608F|nr:SDR family oxidoreductase [Salipiger manganoxidans]MCD1618603.1 SDR family oxidoreductase [Salipiger manganoxidans]MEB3417670.1 SDR family oxidoreductase [Salipiger manganoxidans]